jgi:hypothetical protein
MRPHGHWIIQWQDNLFSLCALIDPKLGAGKRQMGNNIQKRPKKILLSLAKEPRKDNLVKEKPFCISQLFAIMTKYLRKST